MNFIDSFCSNIKKVIALIALMLLLTLVILIFTHTSLGYFLVLLPITLLIIYLLHKIKKLDPENAFIYNSVLVILLFIFILFDLRKDIVLLGCFAYIIHLLMAYHLILKPPAITQQQEKNDIESGTETDPVSDEETEKTEEELQDRPNKFNTAEINGLEAKLMTALENQHYDTSSMQMQALEEEMEQSEKDSRPEDYISLSEIEKQQEAVLAEKQEEKPDSPKKRTLTKAEKEMFGAIAQTKELQEQIAHALDTISLVPFTGNVIITGDKGTGALTIAQNIALDMRSNDSFTGNTETLTAEELDQKDITTLFEKTANGAIIIDHAGDIKQSVCQSMLKACDEMQGKGILLILTDTKQDMDRLIRMNPKVQDYFNVKIDIQVLDNDGLVNFGREYAREQEYSIDDMGVLALYNRIEERQTNEHAVTVEEVKEIINEAIKHADKKNISHFMDVVFAKRYDKEDMIVLREKDFIKK